MQDGSARALHFIGSMLPTYADLEGTQLTLLELSSPTVVVSLNAKNSFNVLSRATVFDVITAVALSFYYYCSVVPGARIPSPECMQAFLPFIEPHY